MNIKSIEVCIAVTAVAILGMFINGYILLQGVQNDFVKVIAIIACIFNIFAFSSFRPIANICGIYSGKNRFLTLRRLINYGLWCIALVAMFLYRQDGKDIFPTLATMNLAMAFSIINAYGFGKTRGKFYWCKYQ